MFFYWLIAEYNLSLDFFNLRGNIVEKKKVLWVQITCEKRDIGEKILPLLSKKNL